MPILKPHLPNDGSRKTVLLIIFKLDR
jgi:hypothetical protein